jgi:hypothetical protein
MYRSSWLVIGLAFIGMVVVLGFVASRYLVLGANLEDLQAWGAFVVGALALVAVLMIGPSVGPLMRNRSLTKRGRVVSIAGGTRLLESLKANEFAATTTRLPRVVSVTFSEASMTFWEGGMDPIPIDSIPRESVTDIKVTGQSTVEQLTTAEISVDLESSNHRVPLLILDASVIGFGAVSVARATKELDVLREAGWGSPSN